jgi:hypothetical protein
MRDLSEIKASDQPIKLLEMSVQKRKAEQIVTGLERNSLVFNQGNVHLEVFMPPLRRLYKPEKIKDVSHVAEGKFPFNESTILSSYH